MSAHAMKAESERRLRKLVDEHAEALADRVTDDLGQMRFNQGVIAGLRMAIETQQDAYRHLGG